jgi:hypothetical protein
MKQQNAYRSMPTNIVPRRSDNLEENLNSPRRSSSLRISVPHPFVSSSC